MGKDKNKQEIIEKYFVELVNGRKEELQEYLNKFDEQNPNYEFLAFTSESKYTGKPRSKVIWKRKE